jgi:hypothetical protein
VFDDSHILLKSWYPEVKTLISHVNHYIQKLEIPSDIQTILCGKEWNDKICSATVKASEEPLLFIGAPMEAIKYSGVDMQPHFVHPDDRMKALGGANL